MIRGLVCGLLQEPALLEYDRSNERLRWRWEYRLVLRHRLLGEAFHQHPESWCLNDFLNENDYGVHAERRQAGNELDKIHSCGQ